MADKTSNELQDFDKYSGAVAHYTQKTVSRIIKEWYLYTLKRKILVELESYVRGERVQRAKSRILRDWFELSMRERLNSATEDYLVSKRNQAILRNVWSFWYKNHYLQKRNEYRTYSHLRGIFLNRLLREAFLLWHTEILDARECLRFQKNGLQRRAFSEWRSEFHRVLAARSLLETQRKRRLFLGYLQYVRSRKERRHFAKAKLDEFESIQLARIFNQWIILVQYSLNKRYTILEWQIGLVNHRMTQMLRGWKLVVFQKKLERSKLLQAIKSQQDKTLLKSFNMWYVLAQESYKEKAMLIISGLSARRHLLVLGFSSLRIYLTHRRQSRILKERSESYLASYLLKVFKRNSSSYAAYKIKLQGAQNLFEKGVAKVCWSQWRQYLLHKKALRSKEGQIRLKYLGRILQKSYKIWNYVWFKTVTNRMIVDCIQVKMGIHVKKTVFYSMLYIFRISKSQFWGIFKQLIARQLKTGFEKLRSQMFEARNQQVLEDQLADRIRQSVLFHRWRALALESQKISRSQLRVIVFRFLSGMREVSALRRRQQELAAVRDSRLGLRVFQSWRLQSRRLANLGNIFQSTSIQAVSRRITMSSYFGKWLAEFSRRRRLVEFTLVGERALKSKVLVIWRCLCARRSLNREKHDRVFGQISHRIRSHFFGRWIQRYRRRRTNREKLAQLVQSKDQRRTRRCLVEMMRVSEVRRSRRRAVQQSLEGLGRLILSKAWLKMKQHFFLERSLERISNKYLSRINYKRLDLIYRHWRFVTARIREIRDQERISEDHFLLCLQRKTLLAWRASLDHELARQGLICQIVQSRSCERQTELLRSITQSWRGLVLRHAELRGKERIILLRAKRRSLDAMIGLFNRVNHFKKRVLDSMHYEFVNSSFFKLQYKRVVQQKRQAGITLQISLEMYQSYSLLKRGMERWLRSMTERIRQRETLQREMELMELRMAFLRLRASFHKLADWASYLGLKEVEARDRVRVRACRAVMGELRRQAEERRFTVQVSDLLYRNFVMRRLLHGLSFWKEKSRYQRECQYKASVLESRIKRRGKFKALIFWRSRSSEYVRYFRLRRSIEVPIKRRVFQALRANSLASRVQEADLRMRLGAWRALSEKKRCLRARCGEFSSGYVLRRLQRRVLGSWRKAYHQKLHVYEFHDRVVKRRPVEKIMAVWSRRSRERLRREGELRRRVQEREKGHLLRSVRVMFRAARMGLEMNKRSLAKVFAEWRRLQSVERLKRYRILGQCLGNWRAYSCARIANRERYDWIVRRRSGRLLEESFIRLTGEYSRRMVVREKGECVMMSRVAREKREIFERWVGRWVQRRRRREICERVSLVHVRCVLGMSLRFWRERLQKEERYRWILDHQLKAMESRVRSKVFNGWRSIWRPYHYLKVSKEMIHVLNRLVLHESFHRLLRATFYACNIRRDEDEGVTGGFGFGSGPGEQKTSIELSYFAECRCSERELRSLSGRSEVVGLLSRMRGLRDGAILDMLMKMSGYVRRRQSLGEVCGEYKGDLGLEAEDGHHSGEEGV
ncbi:very low complexity large protein [Cryptosporidium canis]|uniref:Very low complexity large protein n=1 Tax=Cryptosporidium canis TaxID=195482 RepID=A0ABQ8P3N4_9CRYT|nr:very low complexity large protein [Cryptosporidium canis]